ncbi:MAG: alpha/beta hydrolase [Vulcanococcus sp.]
MRKALFPLAGAGILLAGLSAQATPQGPTTINSNQAGVTYGSPTFIHEGLPTQTARAVSQGFVRSNTLLPLGGTAVMDNPVPGNLSDLSGWSRDQLQAGLSKEYNVDVAAVARFLYSEKGEAFLSESIRQNNYTPYYSQQNSLQAVRSAIILDSADGKLSSYGMMSNLPTDQRLQGAMKVCDVSDANNSQKATSLLSWYMNTPACIQTYTAEAPAAPAQAPIAAPVRGLW